MDDITRKAIMNYLNLTHVDHIHEYAYNKLNIRHFIYVIGNRSVSILVDDNSLLPYIRKNKILKLNGKIS